MSDTKEDTIAEPTSNVIRLTRYERRQMAREEAKKAERYEPVFMMAWEELDHRIDQAISAVKGSESDFDRGQAEALRAVAQFMAMRIRRGKLP